MQYFLESRCTDLDQDQRIVLNALESTSSIEIRYRSVDLLSIGNVSMSSRSSRSPASQTNVGSSLYPSTGGEERILSCNCLGTVRSTSRRIGCEPGNPWPAERDFQDILVQPCPRSSAGCSEGSGSESRSQPDYFPVTSDHYESEAGDKIREGDEHYEVEQGDEGTQTTEDEHDTVRRLKEAAAEEGYSGLGGPIGGDIHRYRVNRPTRSPSHPLPSKSTDRVRIESALRSPSVEEKERRYVDSTEPRETVRVELGPPRRARFGAVQSNPNNRVGVTENGQQLAERESGFHEYVVEGLDAVGSIRNSNTGGVQRHRSGSSSWSEDLEEVPDRLSLQVDDTVECSTNVDEEEDFGFNDVEELHARHGKAKELTPETGNTESGNFQPSGVPPHGREERHPTVSNATLESPRASSGKKLRAATVCQTGVESSTQTSGSDKVARTNASTKHQEESLARIARGHKNSRARSDGDKDVEESQAKIARGHQYPERIGGAFTPTASGGQKIPERIGGTSPGHNIPERIGGSAAGHPIPERIGGSAERFTVRENFGGSEVLATVHDRVVGSADSHTVRERVGATNVTADGPPIRERIQVRGEGHTARERIQGGTVEGRKAPEKFGAGAERVGGKSQEKQDKLHTREETQLRKVELSEERRLRPRADGSVGSATGVVDETEEPKPVRPARPSGGKDRHSKVNTAKGPRDRRVRLSVPTAVQFYDVQDRLGYDQPSKAVEWLINKAKDAIDELGRPPGSEGKEGSSPLPAVSLSDLASTRGISAASFDVPVSGPASGSSATCSFHGTPHMNPYGDVSNHLSNYFMDPAVAQGMFSQVQLSTGQCAQGHLAGSSFSLGQIDLARGNCGSADGCKLGEFPGSPLARLESRVKARERARERAKKHPGGKVSGSSSPSSRQSPPFHPTSPISYSSFNVSNTMQGSVHNLSVQGQAHQNPLQLPGVFDGTATLSGIVQGSYPGTLQNLIMQNPSLQSPFADRIQSSLHNSFLPSHQGAMQQNLHLGPLQTSGMQQHLPTLQVNAQGTLQLGPGFSPGPCSSPYSEASISSPHYSASTLPISQPFSMSQLSARGVSPTASLGARFPTGSPTTIPPGFSPGPHASTFRSHPLPLSQSANQQDQQQQQQQQQLQESGGSRAHLHRILPSHGAADPLTAVSLSCLAASSSPRVSAHPFYSATSSNSLMGSPPSLPSDRLSSPIFSTRRNVSYDYSTGLPIASPRRSSQFQVASSSQIPARIQGLDDMEDLEEDMKPPAPSSPHP